jgi:hypothetical protein
VDIPLRTAIQPTLDTGTQAFVLARRRGLQRVRQSHGPKKYERLQVLKRNYDPDNFFRIYQNIPPSQAASRPRPLTPPGVRGLIISRFRQARGLSRDLLEEILRPQEPLIGLPVMADVDFGHTSPLATLPIGGQVKFVTGDAARIRILQH